MLMFADMNQTLLNAHNQLAYRPIYEATKGLVFFGTPFRGTHDSLSQGVILQLAYEHFPEDEVHADNLSILRAGDESLTDLVNDYLGIASHSGMPRIVCFYEERPTQVASIISKRTGQETPSEFLVDESSGCLDVSYKKYNLQKTHFDMHKFRSPKDRGFRQVRTFIEDITKENPTRTRVLSSIDSIGVHYHTQGEPEAS